MTQGLRICNRIIEYSFYTLFFLIPLVFTDRTSELFELNKMWLTFILALIIFTSWGIKMILKKKFLLQRTFLDIPIFLFLLSQIIATIFSLDQRVSVWGYYSRFNGGLLSIGTYILLYYALVSNTRDIFTFSHNFIKKLIFIAVTAGFIVAAWGIPSHFGHDPTCYLFRGEFNVSCWTESFQPTVRIFSTLGQPAWLAAYMATLLPLAIAFFINAWGTMKKNFLLITCYLLLVAVFYLTLIFTDTRAGFLAFWAANGIFWSIIAFKKYLSPRNSIVSFLLINLSFLLLTFIFGSPISQLNKFTLKHPPAQQEGTKTEPTTAQTGNVTDSGDIRLIVWKGGIEAWKKNPIFGTGVETFAFAYSRYRPKEHNLTSEWDFTYNKAHNEYINYLTTTGIFGLVTYLLFIGVFVFSALKQIISKSEYRNSKQIQNTNDIKTKHFEHSNLESSRLFRASNFEFRILPIALLAGYISILISNFFGFSVVIINIFFFLIPAIVFLLLQPVSEKTIEKNAKPVNENSQTTLANAQWLGIAIILFTSLSMIFVLVRFWFADIAYTKGYNANRLGEIDKADASLTQALKLRGDEPVFQEELALSNALTAVTLMEEKKSTEAAKRAYDAIRLSENVITRHPNNVSFWKNRVRMLYELAQLDLQFLPIAVESLEKASKLAPTDAKLLYNLGYVYRRTGSPEKAVEILKKTIRLKPDYRDAYFTLGLAYHDLAVNEDVVVINQDLQKKAQESLDYVLKNIATDDAEIIKTLKTWSAYQ